MKDCVSHFAFSCWSQSYGRCNATLSGSNSISASLVDSIVLTLAAGAVDTVRLVGRPAGDALSPSVDSRLLSLYSWDWS